MHWLIFWKLYHKYAKSSMRQTYRISWNNLPLNSIWIFKVGTTICVFDACCQTDQAIGKLECQSFSNFCNTTYQFQSWWTTLKSDFKTSIHWVVHHLEIIKFRKMSMVGTYIQHAISNEIRRKNPEIFC